MSAKPLLAATVRALLFCSFSKFIFARLCSKSATKAPLADLAANKGLVLGSDRFVAEVEAVTLKDEFQLLTSVTGIGPILGLTIMLETGDISRFDAPGNYASYCRCVNSIRESNGKKKGTGNRKAGNKYLSWAFSEAAHYLIRFDARAKSFYERKKQKRNGIVAVRAIAHKLARAVFHMLSNKQAFDIERMFS